MPGPKVKSTKYEVPFYNPCNGSDASPNSVWTKQPGFGTQSQSTTEGDKTKSQNNDFKTATSKIKQLAPNLKDEECLQLLCCYKSYTYEAMQKDPKKINAASNHVIKTIQTLKNKKANLSFDNIKKWALNYSAAIENGWKSIETFEEAQSRNTEGFAARIKRFTEFNGGKEENALQRFANSSKHKMGISGKKGVDINDPSVPKETKIQAIKFYIKKYYTDNSLKQQQDFVKLLINSSSADRQLIIEALHLLGAESRSSSFNLFLRLASGEERTTAIASMTAERMDEIFNTEDANGKVMSKKDVQSFTDAKTSHAKTEQIKEDEAYWNKQAKIMLTPENAKKYEELIKKNKNSLTKNEKEFIKNYERCLEVQEGVRSGMMTGVTKNKVNTKEENQDLLNQMVQDAHEYTEPIYDEIIESTREYIQEHSDEIDSQTQEEMTRMMDEATNGEYSYGPDNPNNPYNNQQTNSQSGSQNEPGQYNTSNNSPSTQTQCNPGDAQYPLYPAQQQQGSLGFEQHQSSQPQQTINPRKFYNNEQNQITLIKSKGGKSLDGLLKSNPYNLVEALNKHINDNGVLNFLREALNSKCAMNISYIRNKVLQIFNNMEKKLRVNMFNCVFNNKNAIILAQELDSNELNEVKAQNSYIKSQIDLMKERKMKYQEGTALG